jgi:hypothetical protein
MVENNYPGFRLFPLQHFVPESNEAMFQCSKENQTYMYPTSLP